jgi:hypothetical protein
MSYQAKWRPKRSTKLLEQGNETFLRLQRRRGPKDSPFVKRQTGELMTIPLWETHEGAQAADACGAQIRNKTLKGLSPLLLAKRLMIAHELFYSSFQGSVQSPVVAP